MGHESVLKCFQNHYTKNTNVYLKVFTKVVGNYLVIVPEYKLVIVARWIDSSKIGDFVKKIVDSHIDSL